MLTGSDRSPTLLHLTLTNCLSPTITAPLSIIKSVLAHLLVWRTDGALGGLEVLIFWSQAVGPVAVKGRKVSTGEEGDNDPVDALKLVEVSVLRRVINNCMTIAH